MSYFRSVLVLALLLSFGASMAQKKGRKSIALENIWKNRTFATQPVQGMRSMKDGEHYTVLEYVEGEQQLNKYAYENAKKKGTVLGKAQLAMGTDGVVSIDDYAFSFDEQFILISSNTERIYRHSTRSENYVYDVAEKKLIPIADGKKQQLTEFSPNGKMLAYVRDNNLYVYELSTGKESPITTDGVYNSIINGAPDWVYEEEFALVRCFEWSPDSKHLAYYRFDESAVREFSFPVYGSLYPQPYQFKYPKAGEDNSKVALYCHELASGKKSQVIAEGEFEYIPRIYWSPKSKLLAIQTLNRHQNELEVQMYNLDNGSRRLVHKEVSKTYVEVNDDFTFLENGLDFVWTSSMTGTNRVYYFQAMEDMNEEVGYEISRQEAITPEDHEVTQILGVDESKSRLYYEVADRYDPGTRNIYYIDPWEKHFEHFPLLGGDHRIQFSEGYKYLVVTHSSANEPPVTSIVTPDGEIKNILEDNKQLQDSMKHYGVGRTEFFKFTTSEDVELYAWMIKPPNFDAKKKYPVLMYVYGGPGSQTVRNRWGGANQMWYNMLAQKGYIVVSIDGRGTGGRGEKFRTQTYQQLGYYETLDQIEGAKYLATQPYVDAERIGIWGWSYGGYMSTLCLAKGADIFKMAIAVAPVTNWRYYDSIYTERYMRTPAENAKGYDDNSPINHVGKIRGKYLLVHGTADDNVHFQNTAELIDAMVRENVAFDLAVYPNKNHGIYGGNTRYHLYNKMTDFILDNL